MSVIEITVERTSQDISCEKEVITLEVIDNPNHTTVTVVQGKGGSQSSVMSQKVVTDELTSLTSALQEEIQNRVDADDALSFTLQEEVQNRENANSILTSNLQEEVQSRAEADNALSSALQNEAQERTAADNTLSSEIQRVQQEYDQALLDLKTQMEAELASLRSELLQHLNYAMYLNLPLGGTK